MIDTAIISSEDNQTLGIVYWNNLHIDKDLDGTTIILTFDGKWGNHESVATSSSPSETRELIPSIINNNRLFLLISFIIRENLSSGASSFKFSTADILLPIFRE